MKNKVAKIRVHAQQCIRKQSLYLLLLCKGTNSHPAFRFLSHDVVVNLVR